MNREILGKTIEKIHETNPILFHITNTVTISDCANITLSMGGSPLMSFCQEELDDILSLSSALVLNIGTMDLFMRNLIIKAGKLANQKNVPVILDPVGAGASKIRKELVESLIKEVRFAVIKGNMAEINTIAGVKNISNRGVDSIEEENNKEEIAIMLAQKLKTVIAITGKEDIITDGNAVVIVKNGIPLLRKITGTGCMTASLIGCACGSIKNHFISAVLGVSLMGIAGEIAEKQLSNYNGNGSLKVFILDSIFNINEKTYLDFLNISIYSI